jgi:regulator of protease activity HflC (stomatin/prohibitin superfamily)
VSDFLIGAFGAFMFFLIGVPLFLAFVRGLGLYAIVEEGTCHVYVLFGRVIGVLKEPGLYILPLTLGPAAFITNWLGKRHVLDLRLDQKYLRSQPVNSEEGAPMGVGVWYEMKISDPVAYLFRNADPQGSLAANVSNATIRTLSNLPLSDMLENRHAMSRAVREEVSPKSTEWGYQLGSVYIRKVHFRDSEMIRQIEAKVVNRLRQVTSAIKQDGANQVSVITSTAERQAAVEFAKAEALRPRIIGEALNRISADPEVAQALFEVLEYQKLSEAHAAVTLVPQGSPMLAKLIAAEGTRPINGQPFIEPPQRR